MAETHWQMPSPTSAGTPLNFVMRPVLLMLAAVLTLVPFLGQINTLIPAGPQPTNLRIFIGSANDWLGPVSPIVLLLAFMLALTAVRLGSRAVGRGVTAVIVLTFSSVIVCNILLYRTAARYGVNIDILRSFSLGTGPTNAFDQTVMIAAVAGQELHADLYIPSDHSKTSYPIVLTIHGGAWTSGDKGAPWRWLADQGYSVLDTQYRLATSSRPTWDTAVEDIGCALAWIGLHAHKFDVDVSKVVILGVSSGGNLALSAAYRASNGTLVSSCGNSDTIPKVRAVVGLSPVIDLIAGYSDSPDSHNFISQYIGGSPQQFPDRYNAVDMSNYLSSASPPTLIIHGGSDHLILTAHSREFVEKLHDAGVVYQYIELPTLDHVYSFNYNSIGVQIQNAITLDFLNKVFK